MTLLALAAAATLGQAAVALAQEPQDQFGETIDVNEVALDVLVTDSKGNVIVGLEPGDFRVTENGRAVELTGLTFYSNRRLVESSPALAKKGVDAGAATEDRYFILLIDDQKENAVDAPRLLSQQLEAAKRAKGWIDGELLPNDWVAIASYDTKLKVQQDFTRDKKALIAAVDDAVKGKDPEGNYPSRVKAGSAPSLLAGLPKGKELRAKTPTIWEGLQQIARAAGNIRGRKNLLLFTGGLPGRINTFGQYVPDPRYAKPTADALNDSNVAIYALDLVPPGTEHTLSSALNDLADQTGGRYFYNFTNFSTPLDQIAKENNGYYLLSYRSEHPAGAKGFQEVEVKANNPELRIKVRKGYEYGE
jgi:VWFA-related protein